VRWQSESATPLWYYVASVRISASLNTKAASRYALPPHSI